MTTAREAFPEVAAAFHAALLQPVEVPCIVIRPESNEVLSSVRELAASIGAVMISSARTIDIVWGVSVPNLTFVTVGAASTQAVVAAGGQVVLEGTAGLADLIGHLEPRGISSIVFPHAAGSDEALLTVTPVNVLSRQVYRTVSIDPSDHPVDAVAFASPSAVDGWFQKRDVSSLVVAAIGETTKHRLEQLGVTVDVVPDRPSFVEMARALAAFGGVTT